MSAIDAKPPAEAAAPPAASGAPAVSPAARLLAGSRWRWYEFAFWGLALGLERLRVPRTVALAAGAIGLGILSLLTVNWYYIF